MSSVPVNAVKQGTAIQWNGEPCIIMSTDHVKPGKGPAYVQTKLKRLRAGGIVEARFNSADKVELVDLVRVKHTYSYEAGDHFIFMHHETFEEYPIDRKVVGDRSLYLQSGNEVEIDFCDGEFLDLRLPQAVSQKVVETVPALKGATATNQLKPATTETGLVVKVPPFIETGERIRIDTATGSYIERAKD
jgi:elongation factor P